MDRVAAASNAVGPGHVVPGAGNRSGKKMDPCAHLPTDSSGHCHDLARGVAVWDEVAAGAGVPEALATP